jgi:SAM-dependent methyltransferase
VRARARVALGYATTIFVSSFLLFLVQPLIARLILPWFGGSASVWTTCMLFFQALLLAGYGYAHLLMRLPARTQALLQSGLLVAAVLLLPIAPDASWKPTGSEDPALRILLLLAASVGLPYFLLASTSPLLQAWFARARPGEDPYRLFAISNLASLAALVGYPFLVEPQFASREQVSLWSLAFAAFAALCAVIAWRTPPAPSAAAAESRAAPPTRGDYALWLALSATGSVLLLAVTNHLTQNVASIPLLWLAPLTLYLLSFIVTFEGKDLYRPQWFWAMVLAVLGVMAWLLVSAEFRFDLRVQLGVFLPGLFLGCLFCHGELYRSRSAPEHLTAFYLSVSAGGALGGVLVALVAPLAFDAYYELGLGLVALGLLAALRFRGVNPAARWASLAVLLATAGCAVYDALHYHDQVRSASRNFFGVLRVKEYGEPGGDAHLKRLLHGTIMHGEQYLHGDYRALATSYYRPQSGIGVAIESARGAKQKPLRIGVIGLGTGTLATYGRAGDLIHFYDIDPRVVSIARGEFTFLADSKAKIEISIGDARLSLEREPPHGFDVLAVDAFSSDAIPVHLITREALAAYLRHMRPDGIVAFHVSNRFLDLVPVVGRIARELGAHSTVVRDRPGEDSIYSQSDWVLVSRDLRALAREAIVEAEPEAIDDEPGWRTWTDDYSNLVQILK